MSRISVEICLAPIGFVQRQDFEIDEASLALAMHRLNISPSAPYLGTNPEVLAGVRRVRRQIADEVAKMVVGMLASHDTVNGYLPGERRASPDAPVLKVSP